MLVDGQMTLWALMQRLNNLPKDAVVQFYDGTSPNNGMSYRGYYSDLSFGTTDMAVTVGMFLRKCDTCRRVSMEGYKGGDFYMDDDTPVWASNYGEASGMAITGVADPVDGICIIQTGVEADD